MYVINDKMIKLFKNNTHYFLSNYVLIYIINEVYFILQRFLDIVNNELFIAIEIFERENTKKAATVYRNISARSILY